MNTKNIHHKVIDQIVGNNDKMDTNLDLREFENDPDNALLYNQYKEIWNQSKQIQFPEFDEKKALKQTFEKIQTNEPKHHLSIIWKIAAVFVIGLCSFFFLKQVFKAKHENQFVEIFVNKGEKLTIRLPDGNKVWLNSNTSIKYPANFTGFNKRLEIKGEAFFEFKNNRDFPIIIATQNVIINCDSGNFNVKCSGVSDNYATWVTVEKGKVFLNNNILPEAITVEGGFLATLTSKLPLFLAENPSANYNAWKTGKLTFIKVPLAIVANDLSDYYGIPVKIKGEIRNCEFTSEYRNADISAVLSDIKNSINVSITKQPNEIIITGNNCQ